MKSIIKYKDEIGNREFKTKKEALESEAKFKDIENMFSFWKEQPKDEHCEFANGAWCYERTQAEFDKLKDTLILAIKKYEKWIYKQYDSEGGLQRKHIAGGYMIGRYLDDGNSPLRKYYCIITEVCPICYRQWGQAYYANNCFHSIKGKL